MPVIARQLAETSGQRLVAVQTVLNERYWHELRSGLTAEGMSIKHVVLDADRANLERRIEQDENTKFVESLGMNGSQPVAGAPPVPAGTSAPSGGNGSRENSASTGTSK